MIARKELGLDHLSDPDTQNLREFNPVWAIFESLIIGLYVEINLYDSRLDWSDTITRKKWINFVHRRQENPLYLIIIRYFAKKNVMSQLL